MIPNVIPDVISPPTTWLAATPFGQERILAWIDGLVEGAGRQLVYSILVFALVAVLVFLLRRRAPALRLALWSLVLIRLLLPPDLSAPFSARSLLEESSLVATPIGVGVPALAGGSPPAAPAIVAGEVPAINAEAAPEVATAPSAGAGVTWRHVLLGLWLLGTLTFVLRFLARRRSYRRLLAHAEPVEEKRILTWLWCWKKKLRIRRPVRLVTLDADLSPFTLGVVRPVVFLPRSVLRHEDPYLVEGVLAHELAHVKRYDDLLLVVCRLVQALYFFHPATWIATRRIADECELLSDALVLRQTSLITGRSYSESILTILRMGLRPADATTGFTSTKEVFLRRLDRILSRKYSARSGAPAAVVAALLIGIFVLPLARYADATPAAAIEAPSPAPPALLNPPPSEPEADAHRPTRDVVVPEAPKPRSEAVELAVASAPRQAPERETLPRNAALEPPPGPVATDPPSRDRPKVERPVRPEPARTERAATSDTRAPASRTRSADDAAREGFAASMAGVRAGEPLGFQVIVNAINPTTSISRRELSMLFLESQLRWSNWLPVKPVEPKQPSLVRNAFARVIHDKSIWEIEDHWQRLKFQGRGQPPLRVSTEDEVIEFVRRNSGAIGYVSAGAWLGSGVWPLEITELEAPGAEPAEGDAFSQPPDAAASPESPAPEAASGSEAWELGAPISTSFAERPEFVVIVHAENPVQEITRRDLSKVFKRSLKRWTADPELACRPVDRKVGSPVARAFSRAIHVRSAQAMEVFWQHRIFSGQGTPPPKLESDEEVVAFVGQDRGAVGYVSADARLTSQVKILRVTNDP